MNNNKAILPIVIIISLLVGAGGMYAGVQFAEGNQAEPVIEQISEDELTEADSSDEEQTEPTISTEEQMEKFQKTYEMVLSRYVDDLDESELLEGAINGMLESLDDPYSVYMDQETAQEFMESLDSSFEGIGAEVSMTNGKVTIVAPFRDSPAEKAGLRPNDQIIKVDGEDIEGLSLYDAVLQIRGEKGTTVTLTVQRPGVNDLLDFDVVRDEIPIETVYSDVVEENGNRIGVIELTSFSTNTSQRFEEELTQLESEGIDGLIIDVRGNPGGFLQSVEEIGNLIIPGGEPVVQIENRDGERVRHISSLQEDKDYPMVALINEGSASASEILSAAMKEAGGHEVIGRSTFGKGTVQQTLQIGDGSELKLTIYKWLTSDGNFINEEGVQPTIEVDQPDFFYVSPINVNEEPLTFDMNNDQIKNAQTMLDGLGYDPGRLDGYFGEKTEDAVRSFQADEGLEETGEINEETAEFIQKRVFEAVQDREYDNQFKKAIEVLTQ
ncbi:S41 family peptidase [Bacillus shivajii]|uniref:S41 family peptidase n=1 Tax=Bacillus shivajii TaxID=1983719 RepID=UPI001CFA8AD2|nr:S41 family peptidase [Bacillus shivajii]UCZ52656.1 S41 family peptidase [Bacillus shivajii]